MTPEQRRILVESGVEVRSGAPKGLDALAGVPVQIVDGLEPGSLFIVDVRAMEPTPPRPAPLASAAESWRVRMPLPPPAWRIQVVDLISPEPPRALRQAWASTAHAAWFCSLPWWRRELEILRLGAVQLCEALR